MANQDAESMTDLFEKGEDRVWGEPGNSFGREVHGRILQLHKIIRVCKACRLSQSRKNAVPGEGHLGAQVMLVGEAPGRDNDECGRPFVGQGGKLLDKILQAAGINRSQLFLTNILKCRPPANRPPKDDEVRCCSHFLRGQIEMIKPKVIVALGGSAARALLGKGVRLADADSLIFETPVGLVSPTYHPSAMRYNPLIGEIIAADLKKCLAYITAKDI